MNILDMNGILNIYKEKGYTSHDVVARLRGILHQKKIGHTGTLDPEAEGVLPVCVGNATRLCALLTDKTKTYEAQLFLGVTTDTQDATGRVTGMAGDIDRFAEMLPGNLAEQIPEAAEAFGQGGAEQWGRLSDVTGEELTDIISKTVGRQQQIPPMYSALKVGGKKLYELAREGKTIDRKPREIEIHEIKILEMDLPRVRFSVTCSRGTYIRTLCEDIGKKAGCGGVMESLLRTEVGPFALADAKKLSEIEILQQQGRLEEALILVDHMFLEYPAAVVAAEYEKIVQNGNKLHRSMVRFETSDELCKPQLCKPSLCKPTISAANHDLPDDLLRIYDGSGRFYGLYSYGEDDSVMCPYKMFLG